MNYWLIYLLLHSVYSVEYLNFESSLDGNISHQILKSSDTLPSVFTFCSSFKQERANATSFFTIFGESQKPWISLSTWIRLKTIIMWLTIDSIWYKVREIPLSWTNFWIDSCILVNTKLGHISISLNGEPALEYVIPELKLEKPKSLQGRFYIGLSENNDNGRRQFIGDVANLNIYSQNMTGPISDMSANPCLYVGDIVNYTSQWETVGPVLLREDTTRNLCYRQQTYTGERSSII